MRYLIILSFIFGTGFFSTGFSSAENLFENSSGDIQYLAKRKKRRKKRRRKKRKKKAYMNNASSVSRVYSQRGLKFGLGIAKVESISPFLISADYIHPFKDKMAFVAGGSFWTYSSGGATTTFIHVDGGLGYHIDIGDDMNIEVGGRGGITHVSLSAGSLSGSETWMTVTPYGAFNFLMGSSVIGAEMRKPIYLSGNNSGYDGFYFMGFYRMFF